LDGYGASNICANLGCKIMSKRMSSFLVYTYIIHEYCILSILKSVGFLQQKPAYFSGIYSNNVSNCKSCSVLYGSELSNL